MQTQIYAVLSLPILSSLSWCSSDTPPLRSFSCFYELKMLSKEYQDTSETKRFVLFVSLPPPSTVSALRHDCTALKGKNRTALSTPELFFRPLVLFLCSFLSAYLDVKLSGRSFLFLCFILLRFCPKTTPSILIFFSFFFI